MLFLKIKRLCLFALCNHLVLSVVIPNLVTLSEGPGRFNYLERINNFKPMRTRRVLNYNYSLRDSIIRSESIGITIS